MENIDVNRSFNRFEPGGNPRNSWLQWKRAFEIYIEVLGVTDDHKKKTLLLHMGGIQLQNVFYDLPETSYQVIDETGYVGNLSEYDTAIQRLDEYFAPKLNFYYERHVFRNMKQEEDESFDKFYLRIEKQAKNCDYHIEDLDKEIVVQIIEGCKSKKLRTKLLEKVRKLEEVLQIARSFEEVDLRSNSYETRSSHDVHRVESKKMQEFKPSTSNSMISYRCGYRGHISADKKCPAWGKTCNNCKGKDHFESQCERGTKRPQSEYKNDNPPPKKVRAVIDDSEDHFHYNFHIRSSSPETIEVKIGGIDTTVMIDSGSNKTIITGETFQSLKKMEVQLWDEKQGTDKTFMSYSSKKPLEILSHFKTNIEAGDERIIETIYVCADGQTNLLGKEASIKLKLLKLGYGVQLCAKLENETEFPKVPDVKALIEIDTSVKPVIQRPRTIPFSMIKQVDEKLEKLCKTGIIEQVQGFTPWLSPIVPIMKSDNDIRICVDMRMANKAIMKDEFPLPNIDKFDSNNGKSNKCIQSAEGHQELQQDCLDTQFFLQKNTLSFQEKGKK